MLNCLTISSTNAALAGAIIGGVIGIISTLITTWATFNKESKLFKRNNLQKHLDEVLSTYSFALNVFFNMKRDGNPDRASYGDVYARISLYGSIEVRRIVQTIVDSAPDKKRDLDIDLIITAMKKHTDKLEKELT